MIKLTLAGFASFSCSRAQTLDMNQLFGGASGGGAGGGGDMADIGALFGSLFGDKSFGEIGRDLANGKTGQSKMCKDGNVPAPKMNQHTYFRANGCGPQGLQIKENFGLYRCCNAHDICFSVCGTTHKLCEDQFEQCMKKVCKKPESGSKKDCKAQAKSFSSLTRTMGVGFHKASQEETCNCLPSEELSTRYQGYLESFYLQFNETAADPELVKAELNEWQGKEPELFVELVHHYGHKFVKFTDISPDFPTPRLWKQKIGKEEVAEL